MMTTAEMLENADSRKALIENDGIDMAALHTPDEDGNPICGTEVHGSPVNVEPAPAAEHWCEDCKEAEN